MFVFIKVSIINLFLVVIGLGSDVWNKVVALGLPKSQILGDVMNPKIMFSFKFLNFFP
jgi:hypothetical protein